MRDTLKEIVGTLNRVRAVDYSVPARVRLLEALNEQLMTITDLNPLGDLSAAGLTVADWLAAIELRRGILAELTRIDP